MFIKTPPFPLLHSPNNYIIFVLLYTFIGWVKCCRTCLWIYRERSLGSTISGKMNKQVFKRRKKHYANLVWQPEFSNIFEYLHNSAAIVDTADNRERITLHCMKTLLAIWTVTRRGRRVHGKPAGDEDSLTAHMNISRNTLFTTCSWRQDEFLSVWLSWQME